MAREECVWYNIIDSCLNFGVVARLQVPYPNHSHGAAQAPTLLVKLKLTKTVTEKAWTDNIVSLKW